MAEAPSFQGAGKAREPGIHNHHRVAVALTEWNSYFCDYGFRARRFSAPRNDAVS
jgi:hypothetical protein